MQKKTNKKNIHIPREHTSNMRVTFFVCLIFCSVYKDVASLFCFLNFSDQDLQSEQRNYTMERRLKENHLMPLVWRGYVTNPRPTAPEPNALPLELSGPVDRYIYIDVLVSLNYYSTVYNHFRRIKFYLFLN